MAARLAARPDSQALPEEFDLFPESPTPVQQRFNPPPSPPRRVQSHYRPFSTLYTESPYIEVGPKPSRLKRSSSVGAMQALSSMGITLPGKDKFKVKKDSSPRLLPKGSASKMPASLKFKSRRGPGQDEGTSSSPSGMTRPSPTTVQMKKKRSMASLFTSSEASVGSGNEPNPGLRRSPLGGAHHVSSPPPASDNIGSKTSPSNKAVTFKHSSSDPDVPSIFLPKHIWSKRHNMTLHPYHDHAPYMQAYDPILLDNDYHTDLLLRHLSGSRPSFHDFGKRLPATVLDLGCGQGHWILHAANLWRQSQITGLDLVDITLPAFETTDNVFFKQANFLDKRLPFPSKSFEFVRMANLALCIPKDLWEQVLGEVRRVLAPGGRVEIIDDQIHFPYAKLPMPDPVGKTESASSLDMDANDVDEKETFDGETLQGHESAETDSTLVSEGSRPSSFDGKSSQLTESPTVRPFDAQGQMADFIPRTPHKTESHKYVVPSARKYASQARRLALQRQTHTSRELEKVFRLMLRRQCGISYRPADRIVKYLQNIFGEESAGKKFSFHIKLAPADSPIARTEATEKDEGISMKSLTSPGLVVDSVYGKKKPWVGGDREKQRKRRDEGRKVDSAAGDADAAGRSSSERSSLDGPSLMSPLPASMNAKAASRLGLTLPTTPTGPQWSGSQTHSDLTTPTHERTAFSRRQSLLSTPSIGASFPTSPVTTPPILTAKAAERLGILYGPNDGNAISPAQIDKPKKQRKKPSSTQSPGLLVWPSTYIPMAPAELEMHACKNIHTLLGCRAALADFIAMHTDDQGKRVVDDDEFDDLIWEYECFRRARLNWPSEIVDPYEDDTTNASTLHSFDAIPIKQSKSAGASPPTTHAVDTSDSFNGQYRRDDLTHVRTIRVFHAVKSDPGSLLGMFRSKSASHTPGPN